MTNKENQNKRLGELAQILDKTVEDYVNKHADEIAYSDTLVSLIVNAYCNAFSAFLIRVKSIDNSFDSGIVNKLLQEFVNAVNENVNKFIEHTKKTAE